MRKILLSLLILLPNLSVAAEPNEVILKGTVVAINATTVALETQGYRAEFPKDIFAPDDLKIGKPFQKSFEPAAFNSFMNSK